MCLFLGVKLILVWLVIVFSSCTFGMTKSGLGFRVETIKDQVFNFTWFSYNVTSYNQAAQFCVQNHEEASLPSAVDLKYFYKSMRPTLISMDSSDNLTFYLNDVLEATTDHPNEEAGESLCLIIKKSKGNEVTIVQKAQARQSCYIEVNLAVCKRKIVSSSTVKLPEAAVIPDVDKRIMIEDRKGDTICLEVSIFYVCVGLCCFFLLALSLTASTLACRVYKYRKMIASGCAILGDNEFENDAYFVHSANGYTNNSVRQNFKRGTSRNTKSQNVRTSPVTDILLPTSNLPTGYNEHVNNMYRTNNNNNNLVMPSMLL